MSLVHVNIVCQIYAVNACQNTKTTLFNQINNGVYYNNGHPASIYKSNF